MPGQWHTGTVGPHRDDAPSSRCCSRAEFIANAAKGHGLHEMVSCSSWSKGPILPRLAFTPQALVILLLCSFAHLLVLPDRAILLGRTYVRILPRKGDLHHGHPGPNAGHRGPPRRRAP